MRILTLSLLLVACGDAPSEAPAKTDAPAKEAAPENKTAHKHTVQVSASGEWNVPGDGIPELDESGAVTTASGLTIITTEVGPGPKPIQGQGVQVHYHGWLAETGVNFDSSGKRGKPLTFGVGTGRVIKGWDEGLMALTQGSKARLRIPAALGYGSSGAGRVIPPNADLVFDVWLVGLGD
jgi:peptidylprolyl isomerase